MLLITVVIAIAVIATIAATGGFEPGATPTPTSMATPTPTSIELHVHAFFRSVQGWASTRQPVALMKPCWHLSLSQMHNLMDRKNLEKSNVVDTQ